MKTQPMKTKSILLSGILVVICSIQSFAQSKDIIWNGKGDVKQSVSHIQSDKNGKSQSQIFYQFNYTRYTTMVDSGSFSISNQKELAHLIEDLQGAIKKSKEASSFEWSRGKYKIKSGGNNSKKKGTFKLFIGENLCPMDKKNAKKMIKAMEPLMDQLQQEKA